jgi:pimeloyl-ACP methyl ester carboxylesterase
MRRILLAALVALVVLLAINTVVTNDETKPAKADVGRILKLPGGDLQVSDVGSPSRPTIALLHGFAGSIHWWEPAMDVMARNFHVVSIDLLGHGGSEKPDSGYSMPNQAKLVSQALDQLGVRRAIVAGHSMGGVVATALAEQDPSRVSGVVIVDSPPTKDAGELPFLARLGFVPVLGQAIRRVVPDSAVKDNIEKAFAPGFDVPDQFVDDFNKMTYTSYDDSHNASDDFNDERSLVERLTGARKPLRVIFGAEDDFVDPDTASQFEQVPGTEVTIIPGAGHTPMYEKPAQTAALIQDFARRNSRAAR